MLETKKSITVIAPDNLVPEPWPSWWSLLTRWWSARLWKTICQGPSPTSHCISIQQTTQGRASDSRNNINNHSTRQILLYVCKIMQIFVLFWKCLCICSRLYSFTIINCMMLVTLISWTNTHTIRLVCGDALLSMSFTLSLGDSLSLYRNKDTALMFSFWMGIDSK